MMDSLHRFFWEDSRARGTVYTLSAIAGILYASVRTLVFHKPERQVIIELFMLLSISIFTAVLVYCLLRGKFQREFALPLTYRIPVLVRAGGLIACLVLLSAPRLSVSTVEAAVVNQRLERAASAIEPKRAVNLKSEQLKARFQKIAAIVDTSIEHRIHANPGVVEKVTSNLEETLKSAKPTEDARQSGVAAFVALVAYARYNNVLIAVNAPTVLLAHGETGNSLISQVPLKNGSIWWQGSAQGNTIFAMPMPASEPVFPVSHSNVVFNAVSFNGFGLRRAFIGTDNESQIVVMNASIEGASQRIDAIVWLNVKFRSSEILYDGGPLYLGDVVFENCVFKFGNDAVSQSVLSQIRAAGDKPVTLVSGL